MTPAEIADHYFHLIFDLEFAFLEFDFFELLGVREVVLGFELVQAIVECVVLGGQLSEFLVGLDEEVFKVLSHRFRLPSRTGALCRRPYERNVTHSYAPCVYSCLRNFSQQHERVLDGLGVIVFAHAGFVEAGLGIQTLRGHVGPPDLEGEAGGTQMSRFLDDILQ